MARFRALLKYQNIDGAVLEVEDEFLEGVTSADERIEAAKEIWADRLIAMFFDNLTIEEIED